MSTRICKLLISSYLLTAALNSPLFAQRTAAPASTDAATAQLLLDTLGKPSPPSAWIATLPNTYTAWTDTQRKTAPRQIQGRCLVFWTMMNDNGPVELLPPPLTQADSSRVAVALCAVAHMPRDWPARPATLTDIKHTLARSTSLGKALALPPGL
jgi:hypothetical protein